MKTAKVSHATNSSIKNFFIRIFPLSFSLQSLWGHTGQHFCLFHVKFVGIASNLIMRLTLNPKHIKPSGFELPDPAAPP